MGPVGPCRGIANAKYHRSFPTIYRIRYLRDDMVEILVDRWQCGVAPVEHAMGEFWMYRRRRADTITMPVADFRNYKRFQQVAHSERYPGHAFKFMPQTVWEEMIALAYEKLPGTW